MDLVVHALVTSNTKHIHHSYLGKPGPLGKVLLKLPVELRCFLWSAVGQVHALPSQSKGNADILRAEATPNFLQQMRKQS